MSQVYFYVWCFFLVGFVGWLGEVAYAALIEKKFVNRGFLGGPICPIYGIAIVLIDLIMGKRELHFAVLFLGSMVVGTLLELVAGFLLEKLFAQKWWDYSDKPLNFHGYICLSFSVLWGFAGAAVVRGAVPLLHRFVAWIPHSLGMVLLFVFSAMFLIDFFATIAAIIGLNKRLKKLEAVKAKIKESSDAIGGLVSTGVLDAIEAYDKSETKQKYDQLSDKNKKELEELKEKYRKAVKKNPFYVRILKAFPDLKSLKYNEQLEDFRKNANAFRRKSSDLFKRRHDYAVAAYESKLAPGQEKPFAHGLGYSKLFWVFMIGNIVGFIAETLWCFIAPPHKFELRVSLVFGPFITVYGIGAVLMTLILYKLYNKRDIWVFLASMFVGGAFEYLCSFLQQVIFGTVSWEYSDSVMQINGRTNLMYSIFWGIMGMVWIKDVYPRLSRAIESVPKRIGKIATIIVTVLISIDILFSAVAVNRWTQRIEDVPATNAVQEFFDKNFDDDFMELIYPGMKYVGRDPSGNK